MSFFQDFFGKTQQKDLSAGRAQADATINQYGDRARSAYQQGADQASGYYAPWSQSGQRGQTAYENSLGLNGDTGAQDALAMYKSASNPSLGYMQDQAQLGIDRAANARGFLNSGGNALAAAKARMDLGYQDYQNWQNNIRGVGQQGYAADAARAGIAQNAGQYAANSYQGQGEALAGNAINYSNALAASRNIGINNLLGVAGVGVRAVDAANGGKKGQGAGVG